MDSTKVTSCGITISGQAFFSMGIHKLKAPSKTPPMLRGAVGLVYIFAVLPELAC